jgi:hypothetical protein
MSRDVCEYDSMSSCLNECEPCPPNPGSRAAGFMGCKCPVMDDGGHGIPWPREDGLDPATHPSWWVSEDCPLHGKASGWRNP